MAAAPHKPLIGLTCRTHVTPPKAEGLSASTDFLGQKAYADCLVRAGAAPVFLASIADDSYIGAALAALDGLLLTGGDDADPALYGEKPHPKLGSVDELKGRFEVPLVRAALAEGLPVFGICGGIQILNVACGGTLHQDIAACTGSTLQHKADQAQPRPMHDIEIAAGTRLRAIIGTERLVVNSTHHQAVNKLGDGFAVTARAPDGIVEAIERPGEPFVLGVQFHPERLAEREPAFQRLFDAFVEACTGR